MPSAPCWRDAEQRKANPRLGSKDPRSISCERREWEKERWFCAITGKPVLVLYCLCWGFVVLKKSFLAATGRNRNSQCKTHQHPKMWRGCDVESRICLITKLNPLQDSQQWFLQEQKGKLGCLVLRIAETSVCCEMTKRDVSRRFTLQNKTETLSLRPYQISVLW